MTVLLYFILTLAPADLQVQCRASLLSSFVGDRNLAEQTVNSVYSYSSVYGFDPDLILAFGWVESWWNIHHIGDAGEVGMLQVLPQSILKEFFKDFKCDDSIKSCHLIQEKLYLSRITRFMKLNPSTAAVGAGVFEMAWWRDYTKKRLSKRNSYWIAQKYRRTLRKVPNDFLWIGHYNWGIKVMDSHRSWYPRKVWRTYKVLKTLFSSCKEDNGIIYLAWKSENPSESLQILLRRLERRAQVEEGRVVFGSFRGHLRQYPGEWRIYLQAK